MDKAEKRALEAYPVAIDEVPEVVKGGIMVIETDRNLAARGCFKRGYRQAEQDNALTIEDIGIIHGFLLEGLNYTEALRRFNEMKSKRI